MNRQRSLPRCVAPTAQLGRIRECNHRPRGGFHPHRHSGFTLIEISIVLVIIGFIVGGVLTAQDLIRASAVRATLSQLEKFNTAAATFQGKYGALPGDISASQVAKFGFGTIPVRTGAQAQGDGNGVIEGTIAGNYIIDTLQNGETAWFWVDLSANSHLIEGLFNSASATPLTNTTIYYTFGNPPVSLILPQAKLGGNNYIYVFSENDINYFGIYTTTVATGSIDANGAMHGGEPGLTVQQAYSIDKKIDDGLPQSGNVTARYENWDMDADSTYSDGVIWSAGPGVAGPSSGAAATPGSPTTCYDNGNTANTVQQYSLEQNNGNGLNCGLSFKMQAGD